MAEKRQPLKRSLTGFEVEMFLINGKGQMLNSADAVIREARRHGSGAKKECSHNLVEIATNPSQRAFQTMDELLSDIEHVVAAAEKHSACILPLGTYPGQFNPVMRTTKPYKIKESIFGKNRFRIAGRCAGFHSHYTLPRGMFDSELRILKMLVRSKIKDSLVNSHNLLIAADPALATFMQSSPYYQGSYMGKDSRVIMYRGGQALGSPQGLYSNFEEFGGLPPYIPTALDVIDIIGSRFDTWKAHIRSMGINIAALSLYGSVMDTTWNPVKINPNGTLEQRGMDMNHPPYLAAAGTVISGVLRGLQQEFYQVVPSDIAIREPFRMEGDVIYIPPYTHVKNNLQRNSAYQGLDNHEVYTYCRRFLKLAERLLPKEEYPMLRPFRKILDEEKTVSDQILAMAKRKGFGKHAELSREAAAEIAIHHSERLLDEIIRTRDHLHSSFSGAERLQHSSQ